ncbi:class I SAM-dependent methyltransferase [Mycolicibacterium sphagni]|uniref:class I SAM-dependent methyltransferase n=1 Tax=Mycolicibacterium sphagni TaxID=1786 RepID=UPI0021F2CF94|nr:class I SAM-dependent methyltransferase [Mycolicibacterium sphagni]MCV7177851.1 class I SAM-dependent methyltransferase [Mycolicibacterium sphagni]
MENVPLAPSSGSPLKQAMARRLHRRAIAQGEISLPAVPGMLDEYVAMCAGLFGSLGRGFTDEDLDVLRDILRDQLDEAFTASPRSEIVITYDAPVGLIVNYHVKCRWWSVEGAYENWIATREPPLFGSEPDARVWALAGEAADPRTSPILDLGAGTGRNALALARRGHPVDVVEMTPSFAESILAGAQREALAVRVLQRDIFATADDLRTDYQLILLSEVVSDFRSADQLRGVFELASRCLAPGGRLVFNAFVAHRDYTPDEAALQLGQQCYTTIFTQPQMAAALAGFPLILTSDDSVYDYEKAHLPAGAWPPTSWYSDWVSGQDVFDVPREERPIEMRWLVYTKRLGAGGPGPS